MARNTNNSSRNTRSSRAQTAASEWQAVVPGVEVRKGNRPDTFSLNWHGAVIHNCRICEYNGNLFIGWPSFKGRDGKYIKTAYVWADEGSDAAADLDEVINACAEMRW